MYVNVPGPGFYDMKIKWEGKVDKNGKAKEVKKGINWRNLSNGVKLSLLIILFFNELSLGIYYEH